MTLRLEVGKYYLNRLGTIVGPIVFSENNQHKNFNYFAKNIAHLCWTANGMFLYDGEGEDHYDLITECTPDGTPIKAKAERRKIKRMPRTSSVGERVSAVINDPAYNSVDEDAVERAARLNKQLCKQMEASRKKFERRKRKWYVVVPCKSRSDGRQIQSRLNKATNLLGFRVVADLDLKGKAK